MTLCRKIAPLVGARGNEVVITDSTGIDLYKVLAAALQIQPQRRVIVMEGSNFPTDNYMVQGLLGQLGDDYTIRFVEASDIMDAIDNEVAAICLTHVHYKTGNILDMAALTKSAHGVGAAAVWDICHSIGAMPVDLNDCHVDLAVACTYKYLNAGPGSTAGCFVHQRNARDTSLPRLAGWWGNDPATRFEMTPDFVPVPRADAWSLSNPSVLSMAPLKASLEIFERVGIEALRNKSVRLTAYLEYLLGDVGSPQITLITPTDPEARGCQLSIAVADGAQTLHETLCRSGVLVDFRRPNIIRAAPVPLYNSFHDVWSFVQVLRGHVAR
ncbi:MAG: kynureninase [Planctomycetes bacterium]|nr:kynureninase [Planctomycetota bacterium]